MHKCDIDLVEISVEVLDSCDRKHKVRIADNASLLEVLQEASKKLRVELLPNRCHPLDALRNYDECGRLSEPLDLDLSLSELLSQPRTTTHFAIELVLAIRVNARWKVAPIASMSPRQITELFELDHTQYTLYRPDCDQPLPLDDPIDLTRGIAFEAQLDGKYGASDQ